MGVTNGHAVEIVVTIIGLLLTVIGFLLLSISEGL